MSTSTTKDKIFHLPLLVIVGASCSGKTEFTDSAKRFGLLCIEWSEFFKTLIPLEKISRQKNHQTVVSFIENEGRINILQHFLDYIQSKIHGSIKYNGILLSGARHPTELAYILGHFYCYKVLLISADLNKRFERCFKRNRHGDPDTEKDFIKTEMKEYYQGLAQLIYEFVDDIIDNSGHLSEFKNNVDSYIKDWLNSTSS